MTENYVTPPINNDPTETSNERQDKRNGSEMQTDEEVEMKKDECVKVLVRWI